MQDLRLSAEAILVNASNAALQIGTISQPHKHRVELLLGSWSASGRKQQTNFSGGIIVESGRLVMNGASLSVPWTHIKENAQAGALLLTTAKAVDWQVPILLPKNLSFKAMIHAQQIQNHAGILTMSSADTVINCRY